MSKSETHSSTRKGGAGAMRKHSPVGRRTHAKNKSSISHIKTEKKWISSQKMDSLKREFGQYTQHLPVIVETARKGVRTEIFYHFAELAGLPDKKLAGMINLTAKTLSNYKESGKTLDAPQGEHLLRLISLFEKGEDILGNLDELSRWLTKPSWKSEEKYIDWLVTPGGVELVSQELDRLAEGYSL